MKTDIQLTDKQTALLNQLEKLFEFAPASNLSKSIHEVFFNYLLNNKDLFPDDFETIVSDFYFLILFMRGSEMI
ncbi:MAG: hypothetical protein JWO44_1813 [Bacteroidetes bacterium]|nr:hypothetical protein [Bacteroidota bacterium]